MNGATAEPLVSTTSPPNTTIMMRIGHQPKFLANPHKAPKLGKKIHTAFLLELVFHGFGGGPGRTPFDPVAVGIGLAFEPQQVLARARIIRPVGNTAPKNTKAITIGFTTLCSSSPNLSQSRLSGFKASRIEQCRCKKKDRDSTGPAPRMAVMPPVEQRQQRKGAGHHNAKRPV